ncbi:MAG: WD40/YVTN/BNR-like repeat-containing protein, partial [Candidatus Omnitrophota bacterium]
MKWFFVLSLFFLLLGISFADEVWRKVTGNLDRDLYSLAISPHNENIIYIGSDKSIFKTEDKGINWQYLYTVKGEKQKINFIFFDRKDKNRVYFATANGLFQTPDNGKTFQKIFREEETVYTVIQSPEGFLYLGTSNGVYLSRDAGVTWQRLSGIPQETEVFSLDIHPHIPRLIYAVCDSGVYRSFDKGQTWERVFVSPGKEETYIEESEELPEEKEVATILPRFIFINRLNPRFVYLGTTKGLFISSDSGKNWEKKNIANL